MNRLQQETEILGEEIGSITTTYLGMPVRARRKSKETQTGTLERCEKKLTRWKSRYSSLGGRVTLINSVLDAFLPTMSLFPLPESVEKRLDALRKEGFPSGQMDKGDYQQKRWRLGMRNLKKQKQCFLMKWLWRFTREEQALWCQCMEIYQKIVVEL